MADLAHKLKTHTEIKISPTNKELVLDGSLTLHDIDERVGRLQPGDVVATDTELVHDFKDEDERHDFMKNLETDKTYFVGIKQKKHHSLKLKFR